MLVDRSRFSVLVSLGVAISFGLCGGVSAEMVTVENGATIGYTTDGDTPIITMHRQPGGLITGDPEPLLKIYGDGRVVVHNHTFHPKAGDYTLILSQGEVKAWLAFLSHKGVLDLDAEGHRTLKGELEAARIARANGPARNRVQVYRSSDMSTTIRINLVSYKPPGQGRVTQVDVSREIYWYGLQTDAKDFSEVRGLADLAEAELELFALTQSPELTEVRP